MPMQTAARVAIVYPGDREVRRLATANNNRFTSLFAAFTANGIEAIPAVYNREQLEDLEAQLRTVDGVLAWVNPIDADGHTRESLDVLLRNVAAAGIFVSTHPDVILKLGTKDVLVETRHLEWGSDCYRIDNLTQLREELSVRLGRARCRVLKQWRGHSGIGVWRVQGPPGEGALTPDSIVRIRHAPRGNVERLATFQEMIEVMAPYFSNGGHMIDQDWQPRLTEGMVRCYLVEDRVVGFGLQAVNALYPAPRGSDAREAPVPTPRIYYPADVPDLQSLKQRLQDEWVAALCRTLEISRDRLPLLWDCDFLRGERPAQGRERYVLCEINVSSVAPFPDSAIASLVDSTTVRVQSARQARRRLS
ncbi:MAG: Cj0069 family protein [Bryobacteraceae bacterium]